MTSDTAPKMTAEKMEEYLRERYIDSRQWVFLTQVRSSTGSANRVADAMAFNMYGSTGYEVVGFEIKVSRSDWLNELKDMSKSNELMEYCDKWYLVVPDANIVKEGELPKNWGLLALKDKKLVQKVKAMLTKKLPMPDYFVASLLRRHADVVWNIKNTYIPREQIAKEIEEVRKLSYEDGRGYNGKRTEEELKRIQEILRKFKDEAGIPIESWHGLSNWEDIAKYVKAAIKLDKFQIETITRNLDSLSKKLADMGKEIGSITLR